MANTSASSPEIDAQTAPPQAGGTAEEASKVDAPATSAEAGDGEKTEAEAAGDELLLYPLKVKGPAGEEVEVQVSPSDTVMDLRQFLADLPETCFYSCYDLILTKPDGVKYHLVDFVEIGEVADVAEGGCLVEMFNSYYDERAVRMHVRRTRELCSMAGSYPSPSTTMALDYESIRGLATEKDLNIPPEGEQDAGEGEDSEEKEEKEKEEKEKEKKGSSGKGKGKKGKDKDVSEEEFKKKEEAERKRKEELDKKKKEKEERQRRARRRDDIARQLEDGIGFGEEAKGTVAAVAVRETEEDGPVCIESVAFSSFNPAPGYRRLQGDLLYLDLVTAEGRFYCVTAHTRGFFVNKSGNGKRLDPRPIEPKVEASTLVGLVRQLSSKFSPALKETMERKANRHPFENMAPPLPPVDWVTKPIAANTEYLRSAARAEDALVAPFGNDISGAHRDWNEELQSCRDLPRATLQDRILRDRAVYRVGCEFVDAAVKGAKAVVGRSLPPINPHDPEKFHMYVHNSIFFSWATDTDFTALQKIREAQLKEEAEKAAKEEGKKEATGEGGQEAKPEANGSSPKEKKEGENKEEGQGKAEGKDGEGKAEAKDDKGKAEEPPSPFGDAEQASYASSNNDLKGTLAMNKADIEGLYTLALAVIDYRGHRVIAQSIIPGILYGDRSTQMLYGSVDNGKTIKWSEDFHKKASELASVLGMKHHKVKDSEGKEVEVCSPVETKGILGSDDRKYLLDLVRFSPRDANVKSEEPKSPSNRLAILRPELVAKFVEEERVKLYVASKGLEAKPTQAEVEELKQKGELPQVLFNVNSLTEFELVGDEKELKEDEELVAKAGKYLLETALPEAVKLLKASDERPMDGAELTSFLHRHGINMRYLGKVASEVKDIPYLWKLCISEMAARATKRVLKAVLRETLDQDVGGAVAHFLNCFLGTSTAEAPDTINGAPTKDKASGGEGNSASKKKKKGSKGAAEKDTTPAEKSSGTGGKAEGEKKGDGEGKEEAQEEGGKEASFFVEGPPGYTRITGDMVWSDITEGVKFKYKFELPEDKRTLVRSIATLRNVCLKMGVSLAAKDYDLDSEVPILLTDVQDLQPLVKTALPCSNDATKHLEDGTKIMKEVGLPLVPKFSSSSFPPQWLRTNEAQLNTAFEALSEAYQILQQVSGPLHPDVAACCRHMATIFYHAGEAPNAILQQHRELIICERLLGNDHPDTIHSYGNLGLYLQAQQESNLGLQMCQRALKLLSYVADGPKHPEIVPLLITIALAYQDTGNTSQAQGYIQKAIELSEQLLGADSLQTADCHHVLALSFSASGSYKPALQQEKKALAVYEKVLGKDDERTKESDQWVQQFLERELRAQKQKVSLAAAASASSVTSKQHAAAALRIAEALKNRPDLLKALQDGAPPESAGPAAAAQYQRAMAEVLLRTSGGAPGGAGIGARASAGSAPQQQQQQQRFQPSPGPAHSTMRGRGVDERAARAAAEARRKAAARGVNLRAPGGAHHAMTQQPRSPAVDVEELINFINAARVAPQVGDAAPSNTTAAAPSPAAPPAGLGAGLGVGLGAVPLAAPPSSKASGKKGGLANGDSLEHAPAGLGGGLGLPTKKEKGKGKKDKGNAVE